MLSRFVACPTSATIHSMNTNVNIIGAGLAGSEAALQLASRGIGVTLIERRPGRTDPVHATGLCAELVCSNSLKSEKPDSAAGMLKSELAALGSHLYASALECRVAAGGALAVDRTEFARSVTRKVAECDSVRLVFGEAVAVHADGSVECAAQSSSETVGPADAVIVASGPLTSDGLADAIMHETGCCNLAFYDAAAPIVMADSIDRTKVFKQSRYEEGDEGDYLNAPFDRSEYENFIDALISAERVIAKDFETKDLFQACQPIEEIARKGLDAPRYGALKPVGLRDPRSGRRPWAVLQLRAEDVHGQSFNLVGFQTNLTFAEQRRIFRMIPGLERAEFARYGVMHRNTFVDSPHVLDAHMRLASRLPSSAEGAPVSPVYFAGQVSGTEGYCEAIRSGLQAAIEAAAFLQGSEAPLPPVETAYGALSAYAHDPHTVDYQPMHVNFGIMEPIEPKIRNKKDRYAAYAQRGSAVLEDYRARLEAAGLIDSLLLPANAVTAPQAKDGDRLGG
jgi:methylenetetrahydrofolate--tRNA-(uracil-5-)-methyltransferase